MIPIAAIGKIRNGPPDRPKARLVAEREGGALNMTRRLGAPMQNSNQVYRNQRVRAIQLGDVYSDTADAYLLISEPCASVISVSKKYYRR